VWVYDQRTLALINNNEPTFQSLNSCAVHFQVSGDTIKHYIVNSKPFSKEGLGIFLFFWDKQNF